MQIVSKHQLQRVLARLQGYRCFRLTTAKVQDLLRHGQWQRPIELTSLIDEQMMMPGLRKISSSRCDTHPLQSKPDSQGTIDDITITWADEVHLGTFRRH